MRFSYGTKPLMRDLSRCYGDLGKEVCEIVSSACDF